MKKFKTVLFSLFLPVLLQPAYGAEKNYSLALSKPGEPVSLDIEIHTGAIYIEGYDGESIEVSASIEDFVEQSNGKMDRKIHNKLKQHNAKNKSKPRSSEGLKSVKNNMMLLEIEEEDNEVEITSEYGTQNVILHIKVPMRTNVEVELYRGGDIEINNISGAIEADTYAGSIIANGVSGPIVAETHNTDIVVTFDKLAQQNPTSLTSHSGNIDISVNKNTAAKINVQSYKGEILSGLATEFKAIEDIQRKNKGGKQKIVIGGMMSAEVNGGGQDITLVTYNGNVYVRSH